MLDNITKKHIDNCRDVLVGKVPDPKSQIEQITLALIYKFMDDMDKEAVEKFNGKAKFFTGEYAQYGWRKLFDPSLSGQDMLALYSQALEKLNTNPNIPELFRNIFKNAYLPYRDPATLKLFLKYINEFEYSHSEKLGDAFEYLLSVMGSQGDAGQFRTPRHIIDFVTACVNPQKNETVLDPACGTAGFLLSAYKHILKQNTDKRPGDKLKPDDRKKLATHFIGYDISPDMVRLSLANMYLHGFTTPQIHEYDTLSSEDRWQESFDVILANPPFMTPKGGIRPHKKFGVQANKAEVLFTDYIAEHLNSNGRAGIVVPNGIVATSQTAYKQLRKMLVQDSLIAVISLPAGCFNPYSGVKTSVLLLDKKLAKKSKHILFLKIENDGYDLGAQRRGIDKNDLPLALETLRAYKECLRNERDFEELPNFATLVQRNIILKNKDIGLSADRYFVGEKLTHAEYEIVNINDYCDFKRGTSITKKDVTKGEIPVIAGGQQAAYYHNVANRQANTITVSSSGAYAGFVNFHNQPIFASDCFTISPKNESELNVRFLFHILKSKQQEVYSYQEGGGQPHIYPKHFDNFDIPLPPLEIQQRIVAEIEGYQKIIDGANQVVNNYKPTIKINPEWEMVELGKLSSQISSGATPLGGKENYKDSGILFIRSQNVLWGETDFSDAVFITEETHKNMKRSQVKFEDVFLNITGASIGRSAVMKEHIEANVNQHVVFIRTIKEKLNPYYLSIFLNTPYAQKIIENAQTGAARQAINYEQIKELRIPLPSLSEQQTNVKAIEDELQLVHANKRLIEIYEQKIKDKISTVWGVN
jgi:type I restriction enzyme M protein